MIFKKTYGFLIKHFRLVHLIITAVLVYLVFFSNQIYKFLNDCIMDSVNRYNALEYIDYRKKLGLGFDDTEKANRAISQIHNYLDNESIMFSRNDEIAFCDEIYLKMCVAVLAHSTLANLFDLIVSVKVKFLYFTIHISKIPCNIKHFRVFHNFHRIFRSFRQTQIYDHFFITHTNSPLMFFIA